MENVMKTIRKKPSKARSNTPELDVALRLKLFRTVAGLRQHEVARQLDVTVNFVSMMERGTRQPTLKYLRRFARTVGVPVSVLLWDPNDGTGRSMQAQGLHSRLAALMAQFAGHVGVKN